MKKTIFFLAFAGFLSSVHSQDRHFAWSYNSPNLPKGTAEIEAWNTYSAGRKNYDYSRLKQRVEFELGITDRIQAAFYLNADHKTTGPADTISLGVAKTSSFSFSNAWKILLVNPYTHTFGVSTYMEYYLAQGEVELEGKLMIDRITEKNRFVLNSTFECGMEREYAKDLDKGKVKSEIEKEYKWENTLGYMYHPKESIGLGIEMRNINGIDKGEWEYSAVYAGPSIFFSSKHYFVILNAMPQLINIAGNNKPLDYINQEKFTCRALLGITF